MECGNPRNRTESQMTEIISVLVPVGMLGVGVQADEVKRGIAAGADVIALDAGSTDSGAAYLATGVAKYNREAIKRDLLILMAAQAEAGDRKSTRLNSS